MSEYLLKRRAQMLGIAPPDPKKEIKPIAKQSEKRKVEQRAYRKIVKEMLKDGVKCKIGAPGCTKIPSGCHHRQKRSPKNLLDPKNLIPCCSHCNNWIEENSKEAIEKGYTKSRFKN